MIHGYILTTRASYDLGRDFAVNFVISGGGLSYAGQ